MALASLSRAKATSRSTPIRVANSAMSRPLHTSLSALQIVSKSSALRATKAPLAFILLSSITLAPYFRLSKYAWPSLGLKAVPESGLVGVTDNDGFCLVVPKRGPPSRKLLRCRRVRHNLVYVLGKLSIIQKFGEFALVF